MFLSCPVSFDLIDAEWYQDVDDAKEDALDWSVELSGEKVIVYQALEGEDGEYEFNKLYAISAWVQWWDRTLVELSLKSPTGAPDAL